MSRMDGYVRVSQVAGREGESFISPGDQRKRIEGWATAHGNEIAEWHEDLDVSGGTMDRPGFNALMQRIRSGETDGVVVAKLDRFGRTLIGALDSIQEINEAGAKFVSVSEGVDPSNAAGRMMLNLLLVLAEFERERIKEGWATAVENVVARGAFPAEPPFGYVKDEGKRLVIDPWEAEYVRGIFERRAKGDTWTSIALWLNEEGVKPRRNGLWAPRVLKDFVRNEVFLGVVAKQGFRNESAHEPILTKAQWLAAQNVHGITYANAGTGYLLAGVLRCAGCSFTLRGSSYGRKDEPKKYQYRCAKHHAGGTCQEPASVEAANLDAFVTERFFEWVGNTTAERQQDAPELDAAEEALAEAEAVLVAYRDDTKVQRVLGQDGFLAGLVTRQRAVDEARAAVADARSKLLGSELPSRVDLEDAWPDLTIKERNRLIASAFPAIFVKRGRGNLPERVRILNDGEAPKGLPGRGKSAKVRSYSW